MTTAEQPKRLIEECRKQGLTIEVMKPSPLSSEYFQRMFKHPKPIAPQPTPKSETANHSDHGTLEPLAVRVGGKPYDKRTGKRTTPQGNPTRYIIHSKDILSGGRNGVCTVHQMGKNVAKPNK